MHESTCTRAPRAAVSRHQRCHLRGMVTGFHMPADDLSSRTRSERRSAYATSDANQAINRS